MASYGRDGAMEEAIVGGVLGVALLVLVAIAAFIGTLLVVVLTEIGRVYQARAFAACRSRPILWIALAILVAVWLLAALLASHPQTAAIGVYLGSWSFLAYVVVVEGCDWYESRFDPPKDEAPPEVTIDQLVAPWHEMPAVPVAPPANGTAPAPNGHHHALPV